MLVQMDGGFVITVQNLKKQKILEWFKEIKK